MPIDLLNLPGNGLNGDYRVYSNFFNDNHVVQQSCISHPKTLLIDMLREVFSKDSVYTYRADEFGFPMTPDMTSGDIDALNTTKILITDSYRHEVKFYPSITIKNTGGSAKPLSINQNYTIKYEKTLSTDANGNQIEINRPTHRVYAGAWEMKFDLQVHSESFQELQEIVDIMSLAVNHVHWQSLRASGLFIKNVSISGESSEPYANDYLHSQSLSLDCYSEWRVEIPIANIIEQMVFYFDSVRTPISTNGNFDNLQLLKFDDIIELAKITL